MGNLNREEIPNSLTTALRFYLRQWAKNNLHTGRPGIIETYDAETRRARVLSALRIIMTGDRPGELGKNPDGSLAAFDRAVLVNVPVVFPSGGGISLLFTLEPGDPVWISFSERGMTQFKETFEMSNPDRGHFFSESDAIALPGFGGFGITPAGQGATLQTNDANSYVEVHGDKVEVRHGNQRVTITDGGLVADVDGTVSVESTGDLRIRSSKIILDGEVEITGDCKIGGGLGVNGGSFEHSGRNVGQDHMHGGVQPGGGVGGPPR